MEYLDEQGLAKLWELITEYVGAQGGLAIQTTPPSNHQVLWIDTANGGIAKYWNGASWVIVKATWG